MYFIRLAAKTCAPLAMAIALDLKKGVSHQDSTSIEFHVVDIASAIGWNSGVVKHQLKNLEWTTGKYIVIIVLFASNNTICMITVEIYNLVIDNLLFLTLK